VLSEIDSARAAIAANYLDSWYGDLTDRARVARMYAPQVTPA
jgi:hypothetical protein